MGKQSNKPSTHVTIVFETSALIGVLNHFTNSSAFRHTHMTEERIREATAAFRAPLDRHISGGAVDCVVIPDHAIYECTGILPLSVRNMTEELRTLYQEKDFEALQQRVEFYATASPRTGKYAENGDFKKDQIRGLLYFIAANPDENVHVAATKTAEDYCKRLEIDHALFCGIGSVNKQHTQPLLDAYRPNIGNIVNIMGADADTFDTSKLRIHVGQLLMMGLMNQNKYDDMMKPELGAKAKNTRFVQTSSLLDYFVSSGQITAQEREHIKKELEKKKQSGDEADRYITVAMLSQIDAWLAKGPERIGLMERHGINIQKNAESIQRNKHLRNYLQARNKTLNAGFEEKGPNALNALAYDTWDDGAALSSAKVLDALRPTRMLMEHYLYGGILPKDEDSVRIIANRLGFRLDEKASPADMRIILKQKGFYELSPTLGQLKQICADLPAEKTSKLKKVIDEIQHVLVEEQRLFNFSARNLKDNEVQHKNGLTLPMTGAAYEKVFTEELINGRISFKEFFDIAVKSNAIKRNEEGTYHDETGNIKIHYNEHEPEQSKILIRIASNEQKDALDFGVRTGLTRFEGFYGHGTRGKHGEYFLAFTVKELIEICQLNRNSSNRPDIKDRLEHVFEAMLYPRVHSDAAKVRQIANEVLHQDQKEEFSTRLTQLEKDFSNRFMRRWSHSMPPYSNSFTVMHTNRRIARKNLGEIATMEAAIEACEKTQDADTPTKVYVINHDSDLFPKSDKKTPTFSERLVRMHADKREITNADGEPASHGLNALKQAVERYHGTGTLELVLTTDYLDALSHWMHRPSGQYSRIHMTRDMQQTAGFSNSWKRLVVSASDARPSRR